MAEEEMNVNCTETDEGKLICSGETSEGDTCREELVPDDQTNQYKPKNKQGKVSCLNQLDGYVESQT